MQVDILISEPNNTRLQIAQFESVQIGSTAQLGSKAFCFESIIDESKAASYTFCVVSKGSVD